MKPPRSMRNAVRSFLGVKKKQSNEPQDEFDRSSNFDKTGREYGSALESGSHGNRRPGRSQSNLGERSTSLPPATRQRIEEWNRNSHPDFDVQSDEGMMRTVSASSRRSQEIQSAMKNRPSRLRSSQSMSAFDARGNNARRGVSPWDSISRTSSQRPDFPGRVPDHMSRHRDSGTFDMYVNEDITFSEPISEEVFAQNRVDSWPPRNIKRYSSDSNLCRDVVAKQRPSKTLPRVSSFASAQSSGLRSRTTSKASNASERLLSCMDTLDHLTQRLASISQISNEVENFCEASDKMGSMKMSRTSSTHKETQDYPRKTLESLDWSIGQDQIPRHASSNEIDRKFGDRRKSCESTSTDSGVNTNCEFPSKSNGLNPPSRPRSARASRHQSEELDRVQPRVKSAQDMYKSRHLRSDSMSSGYSSGSGGTQAPVPPQYYPQNRPAPVNQNAVMSPYSLGVEQHPSGYNYNQGYGSEDPYGYGSYYASSSVYEEDLNQRNGWFYLPSTPQIPQPSAYPVQMPQYPPQIEYPHHVSQYPAQNPSYQQSYYPAQPIMMMQQSSNPEWQGEKYGALSDTFLDAASGMSPLAAAITSSCAPSSSVTSEGSDWKKYGSFRYRNGERTAVVPSNREDRRRKTVRFSQTVKQRVETDESEMEDSTSLIKGCGGGAGSEYDSPTSLKAPIPDVNPMQESHLSANALTSQPIYEFPSGHIESSCMCSDCILARGSCQLEPAANFAYY